jgi:hypothetical protein
MCCGAAFWKKILVFSLTFVLGVFVAGLFISNRKVCTEQKVPPAEIKNEPPLVGPKTQNDRVFGKKKCVPVGGNLKYERLTAQERSNPEAKKADRKKFSKTAKENDPNGAKSHFYDPSRNPVEVKDLLHRETCFETEGQK